MFSTPAVAGNLLIVGSCNGLIRALDTNTAEVRWTYDIQKDGQQSQFHGDALFADDLVIIGTDGLMGHIYAFERSTGKVRWKYKVNERGVATDAVRLGPNVYAVTLGDELVCLDLESGRAKWTFHSHFSGPTSAWTSSPAVGADRVYFGGLDGNVYALDAQSGKLTWSRDLRGRVTTSVVVRGEDLYVGTVNSRLYRLHTTNGEVLGELAVEAQPQGRLLIAGDSLVVFLGEDVLASVDLSLKETLWTQAASKEWTSARPYVWRGSVLAGDRRQLVAFKPADGTREWSREFPGTIRGIGTSAGVLYVGTLQGPIYAYAAGKKHQAIGSK